ncbi:MAG: hypothetical protein ABWK00_06220, partial [Desulfurococcaceae archaeon]
HLLDFAQRPYPFEPHYWMRVMRNIPPLLDVLLLPAALLGHAWTTFKLYPPIAYAALAAAAVLYAQRALGLGWRGGVLAGLATALYILNLRISWDYQRQLLGSVLMILSLAYLDSRRRWGAGEATVAAALLVLTALSHEVTALASIFLAAAYAHAAARRSDWAALTAGLAALAFSALLELWYWGPARLVVPSEYTAVLPPGLVPYNAVDSTREAVSYLVAGFGPTLPLALIAISALRPRYTAVALGTLLAAGLSPLVAPYTAVVTWYRFLIGVAPIVAPLAVAGLLRATCDGRVIAAYLLFLAVPGILFAYSFSQASMLATSLREFPPALIPAGVDRLKDWSQLAQYFAENPPAGPILVEDESTARWVHLAIRNPTPSTLVWAFPISQVCNLSSASGPLILVTRGKLNLTCGPLTLLYNGTYKVYRLDPVPSLH